MADDITNIRKPLLVISWARSPGSSAVSFRLNRGPMESEERYLFGALELVAAKLSGDEAMSMSAAAALDLILGHAVPTAPPLDRPEAAHPSMVRTQCQHCLAPIKDGKYRNEAVLAMADREREEKVAGAGFLKSVNDRLAKLEADSHPPVDIVKVVRQELKLLGISPNIMFK